MDYTMREKTEKFTRNKYESVIVAARLARKLNNERLVAEEQLGPDAPMPDYPKKVTTEAIEKLATGEIEFQIPDEIEPDDQTFLDEQI